jgi:hypothetical protein
MRLRNRATKIPQAKDFSHSYKNQYAGRTKRQMTICVHRVLVSCRKAVGACHPRTPRGPMGNLDMMIAATALAEGA